MSPHVDCISANMDTVDDFKPQDLPDLVVLFMAIPVIDDVQDGPQDVNVKCRIEVREIASNHLLPFGLKNQSDDCPIGRIDVCSNRNFVIVSEVAHV